MGKRIKIISQSFYPDFVATGELLYELACSLHKKYNINISVLTAQPAFILREKLSSSEIINGVNIKRLAISKIDKNSFSGKVINSWVFFINALLNSLFSAKTDYYLIPTSPPLAPLIGYIIKKLRGQKYIYLMHDVYPEIAWKLGYIKKDGVICKAWKYLTLISLKNADKIIVLSDDMKKGLTEEFRGLDEQKISVIHNWANEENIKVIPGEENYFFDKYGLKDKFIVEYSGNIGKVHEFATIIETAKLLQDEKDIIFLFIGDGGRKKEAEELVKKYGLNNVKFLPFQKREHLSYSLGIADVHLLSLQKGYEHLSAPSKLYGILACGKPVIFVGSKNCYINRIITDNNCGKTVETGNSEELKQVILELKNNPGLRTQMGKNSLSLFRQNFTLSKISTKYYDLIADKNG